jgi:hypothetical protein
MVKNPTKKANARHLCAHLDMIEKTVEKNATTLGANVDPQTTDVITHKDWGSGYAEPAKRPDVKGTPALEKRVQESVAEVTAKSLSQDASSVSHHAGAHPAPSHYLAPLPDGSSPLPPGAYQLPNKYTSQHGVPAPYIPAAGSKATGATAATAASQAAATPAVTAAVETPPAATRTATPGPAPNTVTSTGKSQPGALGTTVPTDVPPAPDSPRLVLSSRTSTAGGASLVSVDSTVEIRIKEEEESLFV